jgi:hypothetical protein
MDKNSASRVIQIQAALKNDKTRNNAAFTGFLIVTTIAAETTSTVANK